MIESEKFQKIKEEFKKFYETLPKENEFYQKICYFFEQGLENMKDEHFEISMMLFCIVIESIASKKYCPEYKTFDKWIIENKKERLNKFVNDIKKEENKEKVIENWYLTYKETYGLRKNFVKIIIEDTYKKLKKVPFFINIKCEKMENGIITSYQLETYSNEEEVYSKLSKIIKKIYDDYRSPFTHEGKFLKACVKIDTLIGGISNSESVSLQDISNISLNVMKQNLLEVKT